MINLDTIKGNNVWETLQFTTQKFDSFEISAPSNVTSEKGKHYEVKIIGECNVIPKVFTQVKNKTFLLNKFNNVKLQGNVISRIPVTFTT